MRRRVATNFWRQCGRSSRSLSAGARSRSEAQREEVIERYQKIGAEVLRTYEDGAIIVETDGKTLRYTGFKSGKKGEVDLAAIERK